MSSIRGLFTPGISSLGLRRFFTPAVIWRAAITLAVLLCLVLSFLRSSGDGETAVVVAESLRLRDHTCPSGWVHHRGSCYYFSYTTAGWDAARRICGDRHPRADLAMPRTREEARFLRDAGLPFVWLGGTDTKEEGVWRWADGGKIPAQLLEDNWAKGQPDNYGGDQNCVGQNGAGAWEDASCASRHQFVCQVRRGRVG